MEKIKTNVFVELYNLLEQVKTIVKDNGGFLNTQNNDYSKDTMYAYVVNWDNVDSIEEQTIVCMRVVDNRLELGLSVEMTNGEKTHSMYIHHVEKVQNGESDELPFE